MLFVGPMRRLAKRRIAKAHQRIRGNLVHTGCEANVQIVEKNLLVFERNVENKVDIDTVELAPDIFERAVILCRFVGAPQVSQ